ncbi:MAG: polysulfide reductase NrfD [Nitrospirae bacterium]|nr:polysulfide reductase NrfD [Nitrospirota bacterium]
MDMNVLYNVPHEIPLTIAIATYFYMVGLHAGCSLLSIGATLTGKKEYKPIAKIGAIGVIILFSTAPILLVVDLGQPLRFWYLMTRGNSTSPLTWGSVFLCSYPITTTIYIVMLFKNNMKYAKIFGAISLPLAIGVHAYTGFVLSMGISRVAWSTSLMPIYFLSSAMVSGIALMTLIGIIRHWTKNRKDSWADEHEKETDNGLLINLTRLAGVFMILNLFIVFTEQVNMRFESEEAVEAAKMLLTGHLSSLYAYVDLGLGNLLPVLAMAVPGVNKNLKVWAVLMVFALIGVYIMRYTVTVGGQFIPIM